MSSAKQNGGSANFGMGWVLMCLAFALHTVDEATHSFLMYYNATVLTLYGHFSWFPRIELDFRSWLLGLVLTILVALCLVPFAFKNAGWLRPFGYIYALGLLADGAAHILVQIRGGTVPSVRFEGPGPGLYTAPLLILASSYLFWQLRRSRMVNLPVELQRDAVRIGDTHGIFR